MRKRIDEMVDMLGQLLTKPTNVQEEMLREFHGVARDAGMRDLADILTQVMDLPSAKRAETIAQIRGQLLLIKRDQFGG
jgi:hypothetical protein